MAEQERKLATILAMDVVGYSSKMSKNEAATVEQLRICQGIIETVSKEKSGRIFNTAGDAFMIEFPTTIGAVETAIEIQEKVASHNKGVSEDERLEFRMGVNIGDVTIDGENLLGDGVNIAARLEGIAPPAGICISESVHSTVRGKVSCSFIDQGVQNLKNIEEPVRAYYADVQFGTVNPNKFKAASGESLKNKWGLIAAGAVVVALILGYVAVFDSSNDEITSFNKIAVLPLESLSGGEEQESLAIGLSQDLGSGLSRAAKGLVIITVNQRPEDVSTIGQSTGAKYIVSGNVRQAGKSLRVGVNLIDAADMSTIWTETYDRKMDAENIFELQDEIVKNVVHQLVGAGAVLSKDINKRVAAKGTLDLTAYECVNFSRGYASKGFSKSENEKALSCLEKAVVADPEYQEAWKQLAMIRSWSYTMWAGGDKAVLKEAASEIERAISLDPNYGAAYGIQAEIAFYNKNWKKMYSAGDRALELIAGDPMVMGQVGWFNAMGGECTAQEITDKKVYEDELKDGNCRWNKGCWDLGLQAHDLDTGNYVPWENYLLANCYNVGEQGDSALKVLEMVPSPGWHWWELQTGIAHHMAGNSQEAMTHIENTKKSIGSDKLEDLYPHFQMWNMHRQIWPVYEPILKNYGFK